MQSRKEIADAVKMIYAEIYEINEVKNLKETGQIPLHSNEDFNNYVEFLDALEQYFKIDVPTKIFQTIEEIIKYVESPAKTEE